MEQEKERDRKREREKEDICLQEESDGVGSEMKGQRSPVACAEELKSGK